MVNFRKVNMKWYKKDKKFTYKKLKEFNELKHSFFYYFDR